MQASKRADDLCSLLQRAGLADMAAEARAVQRAPVPVQVGVIGEFSAGKSALINAVLGRAYLPESDQPTTGEITLIEAVYDLPEPTFMAQDAEGRRPVGAIEFSDLVTAGGNRLPVLLVPASQALPAGFRLIDTPGLQSLRDLDAQTTLGFTAYLDAILICVDINRGGLSASLVDFLKQPAVLPLRRDAVVVLCKADQKNEAARSSVRAAVLDGLRALMSAEEWERINEDDRVLVVSAKASLREQDFGVTRLLSVLNNIVYGRRAHLEDTRRLSLLAALSVRAVATLEDRVENLTFDDAAFQKKKLGLEQSIEEIHAQRKRAEEKVETFRDRLTDTLRRIARTYQARLMTPSKEERKAICGELLQSFASTAQQCIRGYIGELGEYALPVHATELQGNLERIYAVRDRVVNVITAVAVAALSGGTSLGANAAEAAGGGLVQAAGRFARSARGQAFAKVLSAAGFLLRDVNPIEHMGDWFAGRAASNTAGLELDRLAAEVATDVMQHVHDSYLDGVLAGAEAELAARARELQAAKADRRKAAQEIQDEQRRAREFIRELQAWSAE